MSEFVNYLHEIFALFGPIQTRRMFSGFGIFRDGLMFGLVIKDELYLKADKHNAHLFAERGLPPFEYEKKGKVTKVAYYLAPHEIMDDPDEATLWARRSFGAALRAKKPEKKTGKNGSTKTKGIKARAKSPA